MVSDTPVGIRPGLEGSSNSGARLKGHSPRPILRRSQKASMDRLPWLWTDPTGMTTTANAVKQAKVMRRYSIRTAGKAHQSGYSHPDLHLARGLEGQSLGHPCVSYNRQQTM